MPVDLQALNEEDRLDFEKRLSSYGLDISAVIDSELTTIPSTITPLYYGNLVQGRFSPITLKTSDFDQVNQWIGTPDVLSERASNIVDIPQPLRFPDLTLRRGEVELPPEDAAARLSVEDLSSHHLAEIRKAAKGYIDGDSRRFRDFKPWIEKVFPIINVNIWPFLNVTVKSGSVLEFGPGAHVLSAFNLTIEDGGLIRSHGFLKVDAVIMQKTKPIKFIQLDSALLNSSFATIKPFRP